MTPDERDTPQHAVEYGSEAENIQRPSSAEIEMLNALIKAAGSSRYIDWPAFSMEDHARGLAS